MKESVDYNSLSTKLETFKVKNKIQKMTREQLIDFVKTIYGVHITFLTATDAILFCRGPLLDTSTMYDEIKLVGWLQDHLPSMRKADNRFQPWKAT